MFNNRPRELEYGCRQGATDPDVHDLLERVVEALQLVLDELKRL